MVSASIKLFPIGCIGLKVKSESVCTDSVYAEEVGMEKQASQLL